MLAAAALYAEEKSLNEDLWNQTIWNDFSSWRLNQQHKTFFGLGVDAMNSVAVNPEDEYGRAYASINGIRKSITAGYRVSVEPSKLLDGAWDYDISDDKVELRQKGNIINVYKRPILSALNKSTSNAITAPMPGKIIALNVAIGGKVTEGDALVVMEAMKMEQTLTAPRDGIIAEIGAGVGELVTDVAILVQLEKIDKKPSS